MSLIMLRDRYVIPAIDHHQFSHSKILYDSLDNDVNTDLVRQSQQKQKQLQVFLEAINNAISSASLDDTYVKGLFEEASKAEDQGGFGMDVSYDVRLAPSKQVKTTSYQAILSKQKRKIASASASASAITPVDSEQPVAPKAAPPTLKQRPCPPDKILNPVSGRCVLRTSTIGKKILAGTMPVSSARTAKKKAKLKAKPKVKSATIDEGTLIEEVKAIIEAKELSGESLAEQVSSLKSLQAINPKATTDHVRIHKALKDGTIN